MCSEPDYYWDVHRETKQKARKLYQCFECGRAIPPGTVYVYTFAIGDEGRETYRTHVECEELRDFVEEVVCGGRGVVFFGGLGDEIEEAGEYLDQDHDAWAAAGLEVPNPLLEVYEDIQAAYPAFDRPPTQPPPKGGV